LDRHSPITKPRKAQKKNKKKHKKKHNTHLKKYKREKRKKIEKRKQDPDCVSPKTDRPQMGAARKLAERRQPANAAIMACVRGEKEGQREASARGKRWNRKKARRSFICKGGCSRPEGKMGI